MVRNLEIVGDIGGTNARFACITDQGNFYHKLKILACSDFAEIDDALMHYMKQLKETVSPSIESISKICLAIAAPVYNDIIDMPNSHWKFSRTKLQRSFGVPVKTINDFTAQILCLDLLAEDEILWIDDKRPKGDGIRVVLGPGTGLGVAIQMPNGEIIPSEAGHVAFAAKTPHQIDLLNTLWKRHKRVSVERVLSGQGLENLYWANGKLANKNEDVPAPEIQKRALAGEQLALDTYKDFFDILSSFAGDLALTAWATDGIYLSGGILPKLNGLFDLKVFREKFQEKGRFSEFCRTIPIALVKAEQPGLLGCVAALQKNIS